MVFKKNILKSSILEIEKPLKRLMYFFVSLTKKIETFKRFICF